MPNILIVNSLPAPSNTPPPIPVPGVIVGPNGKLVSALTGSPVFLIGEHLNGTQFGPATDNSDPNFYGGVAAVTPAQWADWMQTKAAALPAGVARTKGTINHLRIGVGSAPYMAYTGISWDGGTGSSSQYRALGINDNNGRPLYCASPTGGGKGTIPGTEVAGDPTAYRNTIDTILTNFLGAASLVGYPLYVSIVLEFSSPVLTTTGQVLLPIDQPATMGSADIAFWQAISAKYGSNKSVLFELYNEVFGTSLSSNFSAECSWLGQGNGTGLFNAVPTTFTFPTATTSPNGLNGGYVMGISGGYALGGGQTCQVISWQQALNACRAAGATNVIIVGCIVATAAIQTWSFNGGTQNVVDSYKVGGIRQMAAAYHAYNQFASTASADAIVAAGIPFICTEAGSITFGNAHSSPGFSYARYLSSYSGYTWSSVSNFMQPPVANIYFDRGDSFLFNYSLKGSTPWFGPNVPILPDFTPNGTNGVFDTTQIPTASN